MFASSASARTACVSLVAAVAFAACGGGGGAAHATVTASEPVGLTFVIPSSGSGTSSTARKPAYISPGTESIAVTAYLSNAQAPTSPTVVANVGPTLPGCSATSGGTSCTVTVTAPVGSDTFIVQAYSGTNGTGLVLSHATISQNVTSGMGPISVTLTPSSSAVAGDMLGYAPSRTWTYTVNTGTTYGYGYFFGYGYGGGPFMVGVYADPPASDGSETFVSFVSGNPGNVFTSGYEGGAMGVKLVSGGYNVSSYGSVSNGSFGTVPGTALLVPNTMQLGQSWNPIAGAAGVAASLAGLQSVTATVTTVGAVPGIAYCPGSPAIGATVQYAYTDVYGDPPYLSSVSYVPGCGITDFIVPETGIEFTLASVGSQNLGTLSLSRQAQSPTLMGTLHTLWQHAFVKHAP